MSDTRHRIFCEWPDGYLNSLGTDFHASLQEMVAAHGAPAKVEFRASDDGWTDGNMTNIARGIEYLRSAEAVLVKADCEIEDLDDGLSAEMSGCMEILTYLIVDLIDIAKRAEAK
jgi:hypothetical protein